MTELVLVAAHGVSAVDARVRVGRDARACLLVSAADEAKDLAVVLGTDVAGRLAGECVVHAVAEALIRSGWEDLANYLPVGVDSRASLGLVGGLVRIGRGRRGVDRGHASRERGVVLLRGGFATRNFDDT